MCVCVCVCVGFQVIRKAFPSAFVALLKDPSPAARQICRELIFDRSGRIRLNRIALAVEVAAADSGVAASAIGFFWDSRDEFIQALYVFLRSQNFTTDLSLS